MSVRDELQAIYNETGELVARDVLRYVRNAPGSYPSIYSQLEWDDETAADEYRVRQVMGLIRSVRITFVDGEESTRIRAWHSLPTANGHTYRPIKEIKDDPFQRQLLLQRAEREWVTLYEKYKDLEEFLTVVAKSLDRAS